LRSPLRSAARFVLLGADVLGHLELHQLLRHDTDALAQEIDVAI